MRLRNILVMGIATLLPGGCALFGHGPEAARDNGAGQANGVGQPQAIGAPTSPIQAGVPQGSANGGHIGSGVDLFAPSPGTFGAGTIYTFLSATGATASSTN